MHKGQGHSKVSARSPDFRILQGASGRTVQRQGMHCNNHVRVIPEKCTLCGLCKDACKYHAVQGERQVSYRSGYLPFEIRQKRCVKCGDCMTACPYGAIEIIEEKSGVLV